MGVRHRDHGGSLNGHAHPRGTEAAPQATKLNEAGEVQLVKHATRTSSNQEEKQLLSFDGDISELRDLEQERCGEELLPFASLVPSALQRLQLALLQRDLRERADLAQRRLAAVAQLAQRISSSGALRQTLRHVLLLGNALNGGDMVQGYSIEVWSSWGSGKMWPDGNLGE
eukprot:Skav200686  [mRNA]  locus=scaffold1446:361774:365242:+ [translate_table: standard]